MMAHNKVQQRMHMHHALKKCKTVFAVASTHALSAKQPCCGRVLSLQVNIAGYPWLAQIRDSLTPDASVTQHEHAWLAPPAIKQLIMARIQCASPLLPSGSFSVTLV